MSILVASTCRRYKATGPSWNEQRGTDSWLTWAERWRAAGHSFFLALQTDPAGTSESDERPAEAAMDGLADLVRSIGGTVWKFAIDEGLSEISNGSRLLGITTGRNLAHEFVQRDPHNGITHVLFVDTDVTPPVDCIERLLEVQDRYPAHALIAAHIPTYGLHADEVADAPRHWNLQAHWSSAGCLLVRRDALRRLRWRWDHESGTTDDPSFAFDAKALGFGETLCRHQTVATHWPENIGPFQSRGHALGIGV